MTPPRHNTLFHPRIVRERIATLPPGLFQQHEPSLATWLNHLRCGALDETKESSLHGTFLERIFGDILGYRTIGRSGQWVVGSG